jgi:hypothetical protein
LIGPARVRNSHVSHIDSLDIRYSRLRRTAFSETDQAVFLLLLLSISDRGITPIYQFCGGIADGVPSGMTRWSQISAAGLLRFTVVSAVYLHEYMKR